MSGILTPMQIENYIVKHPPTPEAAKIVSRWYTWEYMTLNFGEYVGKPAANIDAHKSFLSYFFAEGWVVDAVLSSGENGNWQVVSTSESNTQGLTKTTSQGQTNSQGTSSAQSSSTSKGTTTITGRTTRGSSSGSSSGANSSQGSASSTGSSDTRAVAGVVSMVDGGPYWYAYSRIRLKRRKLDPEVVLQDMITSFTNAYNEGRNVNNERYDELVALYALMLARTENEANAVDLASMTLSDFTALGNQVATSVRNAFKLDDTALQSALATLGNSVSAAYARTASDLATMLDNAKRSIASIKSAVEIDAKGTLNDAKIAVANLRALSSSDLRNAFQAIKDSVNAALASYRATVSSVPANWYQSRVAEINRQFDAKIAAARATMIANGTYNGTVWPNVESGYERDRQYALTDLADTMVSLKVETEGKLTQTTADVGGRILDGVKTLSDAERAMSDAEMRLMEGGMKVAELERGFADAEAGLLAQGLKLGGVETGFAEAAARVAEARRSIFAEREKLAEAKAENENRAAAAKNALMESAMRVSEALQKSRIGLTELRNTVLKWMYDFMERRDDEYPGLEELVTVADKLGYGDAISGSKTPTR